MWEICSLNLCPPSLYTGGLLQQLHAGPEAPVSARTPGQQDGRRADPTAAAGVLVSGRWRRGPGGPGGGQGAAPGAGGYAPPPHHGAGGTGARPAE